MHLNRRGNQGHAAANQGNQAQMSHVDERQVHARIFPTDMPQPAMISPNPTRNKSPKTTRQSIQKPKNTANLQERHMSMPGPTGTADTEIGRPGLLPYGSTFSRTRRSPAHFSYRTPPNYRQNRRKDHQQHHSRSHPDGNLQKDDDVHQHRSQVQFPAGF